MAALSIMETVPENAALASADLPDCRASRNLRSAVRSCEVLARLREETRALKADAPAGRAVVNVASFKTRYDVSRKYAIPLLEYLDRERVTRRIGDERVVL